MNCENCKSYLGAEEKYCSTCGSVTEQDAKSKKVTKKAGVKSVEYTYCRNCYSTITTGESECSECGHIQPIDQSKKKAVEKVPKAKPDVASSQTVDSSRGLKIALGVVGSLAMFLAGALVFGNNGVFDGTTNSSSQIEDNQPSQIEENQPSQSEPSAEEMLIYDDCVTYAFYFQDRSDYREFLWSEGQDVIVGNPTVHQSQEFRGEWDKLLEDPGNISWPDFAAELAMICFFEANFDLVIP
jgi:hypothetical protein